MTASTFHDGRVLLYAGDCLDVLDTLPENSVDSCVCDPPYHLASIVKRFGVAGSAPAGEGSDGAFRRVGAGFMGKQWDGGDIAFRPETWSKVRRVLKPGAYIVAFSSSRTFGRMSVALEDAGFITHPMIGWIFAQGFPKATRIRAEGYDGFRYGGQALKPALEPIYVGQKPFSEANGTANILRWGTGAVNIDGCRVETENARPNRERRHDAVLDESRNTFGTGLNGSKAVGSTVLGRWPANLVLSDDAEVIAAFPNAPGQQRVVDDSFAPKQGTAVYGDFGPRPRVEPRDQGGSAARFFFQAKADADDRAGSRHPTVKPLDLMRYLVRLVTPLRGLVLDPFAGSGTTGHAALIEGMRAVLIEREAEYQADIARRMELVFAGPDEKARKLARIAPAGDMPLFEEAAE